MHIDELAQAVDAVFHGAPDENEARTERLKVIGRVVAQKRDEAVQYRQSSGIEAVWASAEEGYLGIDDTNRASMGKTPWTKPTSSAGPVLTGGRLREEVRSTAFVRLISRYVDSGYAKLCEILLPADEKAFTLTPTPVPELIKDKASLEQVMVNGQPAERDARPEEVAAMGLPPVQPGQPMPAVPLTKKDVIEEQSQLAKEKAKRAERRIYDWMVECKYRSEMRKVIFDSARLGVGVLKGPFPDRVRSQSLSRVPGPDGKMVMALQIVETIQPSCKWVNPWNLFPHPGCGENIHDGDYILERDHFSSKQVRELKKLPGYNAALIDQVLTEGPEKIRVAEGGSFRDEEDNKHRFTVWYFYGVVSREDMALMNASSVEALPESTTELYAIVTLINDSAVYATPHPLDSGAFPYHAVPWQRRSGHWSGTGVAEQAMLPQRIVNASTRALLNNAGKSSGSQIVMSRTGIEPADQDWQLTPDKLWYVNQDSTVDDVRKAFTMFEIPNRTRELMQIIEYGFRLAEESTNIPLVTQGQSGRTTPETFGAAQLQNNNANQLLRSIGYAFDDYVTEPVVRQLYEWLLLDPDVPEDEKGDFQIQAHGSAALVERAIQDQAMWQMGQMVLSNPGQFGVDPKKFFAELAKSKRLDPRLFQFTEEEQAKLNETPPPPPPQVQVAQVRAQAEAKENELDRAFEMQLAQLDHQTELTRAQMDRDRDTIYVQAETQRTQSEHQARLAQLSTKRELAILEYSNKRGMTLEQIKAKLASDAMKLRVQKELAGLRVPQVAMPAVEPLGRAPNGEAFTR